MPCVPVKAFQENLNLLELADREYSLLGPKMKCRWTCRLLVNLKNAPDYNSRKIFLVIMCSSRKNPYPPQGRSSEIPRGRGVLKVKILEAKYEDKLKFPGRRVGGGGGGVACEHTYFRLLLLSMTARNTDLIASVNFMRQKCDSHRHILWYYIKIILSYQQIIVELTFISL